MIALLLTLLLSSSTITTIPLPTIADTNWEVKGAADLDGDGRLDIIWRNKVTGQNIVWVINGGRLQRAEFLPTMADLQWQIVAVDRSSGIVWRHAGTGQSFAWQLAAPLFTVVYHVSVFPNPVVTETCTGLTSNPAALSELLILNLVCPSGPIVRVGYGPLAGSWEYPD